MLSVLPITGLPEIAPNDDANTADDSAAGPEDGV